MAINLTEAQVAELVAKVVREIRSEAPAAGHTWDATQYDGRKFVGVFDTMEEAIAAAEAGYKTIRATSVADREKLISSIRTYCRAEAATMAALGVAETKMGKVEHKIAKHILVADKTPGTEDIVAEAKTGDHGLTLTERAPFGVVGAITRSPNPSETVICNSMGMIAAGNGVVFNPHPGAIATSNYAVDLVNRAVHAAGGPEVLVASVKKPTLDTADVMYKHPAIRLLVCTGGPGVVKAVLSSGKKAIGAGAGNPPVIVDDTADIEKAAKDIIDGCTFDNNLPCIAEKEVFVFENVADRLIQGMLRNGCILLTREQADALAKVVVVEKTGKDGKVTHMVNRDCVGRDCSVILEKIGLHVGPEIRCAIAEVPFEHTFVQTELMMPILGIVRVKDIDQAIDFAVKAEHGNRHTAHMHSKNIDNLSRFATAIETTIFVKNAPSYAGIGFGGEGHTTFTIAGPTGEGITSARSYTRLRRCVMADHFRII